MLAVAASPDQQSAELRAYLSADFGGAHRDTQTFFYGLRLDHDRRFVTEPMPAIAQVEFSGAGALNGALVNGLPVTRSYQMQQDEGGEVTTMTAVDWGLVVLGVAGVGFAVAEVSDSEESPDPVDDGSGTGGETGGETGGGTPLGGTPLGGTPVGGGVILGLNHRAMRNADARTSREHQEWLDGGSGHMGDLVAH